MSRPIVLESHELPAQRACVIDRFYIHICHKLRSVCFSLSVLKGVAHAKID